MTGNYSIRNILTKEPVVIAGAVRSILFVAVILGAIVLDEKQLAGIAIGMELLLGLFARQTSTSTSEPTLAVGTAVNQGAAVVASIDPPQSPVAVVTEPAP